MIELDLELPLRGVTLKVAAKLPSKVTAIVGPSGAGKTSLLEVIAGLRRGARGRVVVDSVTLLDSDRGICIPPERRRVGYVPQQPGLFPHLDVRGNISYGLRRPSDAGSLLDEVASLLDLGPLLARYPRTLSGGEAQRVALARALTVKPRLLLLDEPLTALDADLKNRILPYLMRIRDRGDTPMLYVTHHVGEALALAAEAVVLKNGRVAAKGPAEQVLTPTLLAGIDGDVTFENIVHGSIVELNRESGVAQLAVTAPSGSPAGSTLAVPSAEGLDVGDRATYRVPSEDLLLLRDAPGPISARNLFQGRVIGVEQMAHESIVLLQAQGIEWRARVTNAAVTALEIRKGSEVWLAIKTVAFERLS